MDMDNSVVIVEGGGDRGKTVINSNKKYNKILKNKVSI